MAGVVAVIRGEGHQGAVQVDPVEDRAQRIVDLADQPPHDGQRGAKPAGRGNLHRPPLARRGGHGLAERLREPVVGLEAVVGQDRIALGVHRGPRLGRVVGLVRVRERHHQEQRAVRVALLEHLEGLGRDPVGRMRLGVVGEPGRGGLTGGHVLGGERAPVDQPTLGQPPVVGVGPVGGERVPVDEVGREQVLAGPHVVEALVAVDGPEVHLAHQGGLVAGGPQGPGHRRGALGHVVLAARLDGQAVGAQAREQGDARRHAGGGAAVGLLEHGALAGQPVQVGRLEVALAGVAHLIVALLVGHDQHDVGSGRHRPHGNRRARRGPTKASCK